MKEELENIKWSMCFSVAIMILCGWVWKFFPILLYPDYVWVKDDAGLLTWIFGGISLMTMWIFAFLLLAEFFQAIIWKAEKRFIRRFEQRLHWSVGLLAGVAIQVATSITAIMVAFATFDLEKLLSTDNELWPIIAIGAIMMLGHSLGWALFKLHAQIANWRNRENPLFII